MPEFSTYIDIEPSEYVDECSQSDIKELIEELVFHGYINKSDSLIDKEKISLMEQEFHEKLDKLKSKYYNLSPEDEETLKNLFLKYVQDCFFDFQYYLYYYYNNEKFEYTFSNFSTDEWRGQRYVLKCSDLIKGNKAKNDKP